MPRELRMSNAISLESEAQARKALGAQREANCELSGESAEEKALAHVTGESPKQVAHDCNDQCEDECEKPCLEKDEPPVPDRSTWFKEERDKPKAPKELLDELDPC